MALGCPLYGIGAMFAVTIPVQWYAPFPPLTRSNDPPGMMLAAPSVSRMTILVAPLRPVYPPDQLNWLYAAMRPIVGLVPPSATGTSAT